MRRKWLVDGLYQLGLKFEDLKQIHDKYERLDLVPTHYNYPAFFCHTEKPDFVQAIELAK